MNTSSSRSARTPAATSAAAGTTTRAGAKVATASARPAGGMSAAERFGEVGDHLDRRVAWRSGLFKLRILREGRRRDCSHGSGEDEGAEHHAAVLALRPLQCKRPGQALCQGLAFLTRHYGPLAPQSPKPLTNEAEKLGIYPCL